MVDGRPASEQAVIAGRPVRREGAAPYARASAHPAPFAHRNAAGAFAWTGGGVVCVQIGMFRRVHMCKSDLPRGLTLVGGRRCTAPETFNACRRTQPPATGDCCSSIFSVGCSAPSGRTDIIARVFIKDLTICAGSSHLRAVRTASCRSVVIANAPVWGTNI